MTVPGKGGQPAKPFDQAIADEVVDRIAQGEGLEAICEAEHIPSRWTIRKWMAANSLFNSAYARASEHQMEAWSDEIRRIAYDSGGDYMEVAGKDGSIERVVDQENIQRSRLKIDTLKWLMSKLSARYADKVDVQVNASLKVENMSDQELEDRTRARLLALGVEVGATPLLLGTTRPVALEPEPELGGDNPESENDG